MAKIVIIMGKITIEIMGRITIESHSISTFMI